MVSSCLICTKISYDEVMHFPGMAMYMPTCLRFAARLVKNLLIIQPVPVVRLVCVQRPCHHRKGGRVRGKGSNQCWAAATHEHTEALLSEGIHNAVPR